MWFSDKGSDLIYGSAVMNEQPRCNSINTDINRKTKNNKQAAGGRSH